MDLAKFYPDESSDTEPRIEVRDIVVRSYTSVGSVQGYGKVEIDAYEFVIPDRGHLNYFIRIGVETIGDYPQTATSAVPYSEIDRLISALEQLSKVSVSVDRFRYTEVEFSIDDLRIIAFNTVTSGGFLKEQTTVKMCFAVIIGGVTINFPQFSQINELKRVVEKAKAHLDSNRLEA